MWMYTALMGPNTWVFVHPRACCQETSEEEAAMLELGIECASAFHLLTGRQRKLNSKSCLMREREGWANVISHRAPGPGSSFSGETRGL